MKSTLNKYSSHMDVFVDMLFLIVLVFLTMINPPVDPTIEAKPVAILTVSWDDAFYSDIDTHVYTPDGEHLSYVNKDIGGRLSLNRDDTGMSYKNDGTKILSNFEIAEFSVLEDGEYRIAVRAYSFRDKQPVTVNVTLVTPDPYNRYINSTVSMGINKQTIPIATVTVKDGKIINVDEDVDFRI